MGYRQVVGDAGTLRAWTWNACWQKCRSYVCSSSTAPSGPCVVPRTKTHGAGMTAARKEGASQEESVRHRREKSPLPWTHRRWQQARQNPGGAKPAVLSRGRTAAQRQRPARLRTTWLLYSPTQEEAREPEATLLRKGDQPRDQPCPPCGRARPGWSKALPHRRGHLAQQAQEPRR